MHCITPARSRRAALLGMTCATLAAAAAATGGASAATTDAFSLTASDASLGGWSHLVAEPNARIARVTRGGSSVVKLSDNGPAGSVMLGVQFSARPAVVGKAVVNIARQSLGVGRARAVVRIASAQGLTIDAGIVRTKTGRLRWATWLERRDGARIVFVTSSSPVALRSWTTVSLATRWASTTSKATLRVNGRVVAVIPKVNLSALSATGTSVGLGDTVSESEQGVMYVRSASSVGVDRTSTTSGGGATPTLSGGGSGGSGGTTTTPRTTTPTTTTPAPTTTTPTTTTTTPRTTTPPRTTPTTTGPATPPPPGTIPGTIFKTVDFQSGSASTRFGTVQYLGGISSYQAVATNRIQSVPSPDGNGRVGRFEVRDGDNPVCCGERNEISIDTNDTEGQERWYTWATMFDQSFPGGGMWQVITQFHSQKDGQPPVAFYAENNVYRLQVWPKNHDGSSAREPVTIWQTPLVRNKWYRIALHVKWSGSDSIGFVELFVDGQAAGKKTSIRTLYPGYTNYAKLGYYRDFGMSQTGVVYHDDFRGSNVN